MVTPTHATRWCGRRFSRWREQSNGDTPLVARVVRRAIPEDVHEIEDVYLRSWRAAYGSSVGSARLEELGASRVRSFDWSDGIRSPHVEVLVGVEPERAVAGVAQANEILGGMRNLPEITMLYVDPSSWGTGLATELLAGCTHWIVTRGHREARLRVAVDHARARRFYEREGWMPDGALAPVATELTTLVYYRKVLV